LCYFKLTSCNIFSCNTSNKSHFEFYISVLLCLNSINESVIMRYDYVVTRISVVDPLYSFPCIMTYSVIKCTLEYSLVMDNVYNFVDTVGSGRL
jgi:hypothetical protein